MPSRPSTRSSRESRWVVVGGQSFGGRVASLAAAEPDAPYAALVLFSYPLHPPGSPEKADARIAHWPDIHCPDAAPVGRIRPVREDRPVARCGPAPGRTGRARDLSEARATASCPCSTTSSIGSRRSSRSTPRRAQPPCPDPRLPLSCAAPGELVTTVTGRIGVSRCRRPQPAAPQPAVSSGPDRADVRCAHRIDPVGRSHIARAVRPPERGPHRRLSRRSSSSPPRAPRPSPPRPHPACARFKSAIGRVESGGSYTARNPTSGAYGKYQIMPVELAGLGSPVPRQRECQADAGEPGEGGLRQDDVPLSLARQLEAGRLLVADGFIANHGLVELRQAIRRQGHALLPRRRGQGRQPQGRIAADGQ